MRQLKAAGANVVEQDGSVALTSPTFPPGGRKHVILAGGDLAPVLRARDTYEEIIVGPPFMPSDAVPPFSAGLEPSRMSLSNLPAGFKVVLIDVGSGIGSAV